MARAYFTGIWAQYGILLMAQELGQQTKRPRPLKCYHLWPRVALAFKTTLVALMSYLPLRKTVDYMLQRVATLKLRGVGCGRIGDYEPALEAVGRRGRRA